ncbi:MAG: HEAT repeat domain-containing protein [Planctomycetes bacterium]|nr:HEAT repeat domain-containing protein [Planctomycetota bacterium]
MPNSLRPFSLPLFALLASAAFAGEGEAPPLGAPTPEQEIAGKRRHLQRVVVELGRREVSAWPAAKVTARLRSLALLQQYAERGEFTRDFELWPRDLPLFIDDQGTRCALAAVLDGCGHRDLVVALAQERNDAYVNEFPDDPQLLAVLDSLGLTLDEAAYIQAPGTHVPPPAPPTPDTTGTRSSVGTTPTPSGPRGSAVPTLPGGPAGGPTPGAKAGVTGAARRVAEVTTLDVANWWQSNLDRFLAVRELYRGDFAATPTDVRDSWRVNDSERAELADRFVAVSSDPDLRATAIGMWARSTNGQDAPAIVAATVQFLGDEHHPDREWAPLLLAMLGQPEASAPLAALVRDDAEGRALMDRSGPIPESLRAIAAIALGRCGHAVAPLAEVLRDQPAAHVDLAAAAVIGLGLAAARAEEQLPATQALLAALDDAALPAAVLAQVPCALALADARAALPRLHDLVARFRGPRELRAAAAHALGQLGDSLEPELFDALLALAKRDVDVEARQAALLALGELALKSGAALDPVVAQKLATFQLDGVRGRLRHAVDVPWHALAAGLFARGGHPLAAELLPELRALAADAAAQPVRSAAFLAIGLARDAAALPLCIAATDGTGDPQVAAHAVYALGLLGARSQRDELLELCVGANDPRLGFAAGYALGCLADPMVITPLVSALSTTGNDAVRGALARTLGEIGDRRALPGLSAIAFDPARDDPTRERALAALGVAAQRGDVAWNAELKHALFAGETTPTLQFVCELF